MIRSELQSGRSRQRRRYTSVPTTASVSWLLDDAESQLFEGWFEYVLLSGSLFFECPLKTTVGLEIYQARFTDTYRGPTLVGDSFWRFTASLELLKRPLVEPEWFLILPDYILMADIFDRAVNQEWPQHDGQ
ncbi:hypothetical protein D3C75_417610 [compost metagenome]|jgi:hypothetical protein